MGIYIPGIEMPKKRVYVILYPNRLVEVLDTNYILLEEHHFVPVSDHGRLGDLDELKKRLKKPVTMDANRAERLWEGWHECTIGVEQTIDALPTIIPADKEGEG